MGNLKRFTGALLILGLASLFCALFSFESLNRLMRDGERSSRRILPVEPTEHMNIISLLRIPIDYPRLFALPVVFHLSWMGSTHGDLYVKQDTDEGKPQWYFRTSPIELVKGYQGHEQATEYEREERSTPIQEIFGVLRPSENVFLRLGEGTLGGTLCTWSETSAQKEINAFEHGEDLEGLLVAFLTMIPFVTPTIEQLGKGWLKTYYPMAESDSGNTTNIVTWQAPDPVAGGRFIFAWKDPTKANSTSFIYRGQETMGMLTELTMVVGDGGAKEIPLIEWAKPFSPSNETVSAHTDDQEASE